MALYHYIPDTLIKLATIINSRTL